MWSRVFSTLLQARNLPAAKSLHLLTNAQLIQLSQQLASHQQTDSNSVHHLLSPYLKLVTARTVTMTKEELVQLTTSAASNPFLKPILVESVRRLTPNVAILSFEESVDIAKAITSTVPLFPAAKELLTAIAKEITEEGEPELLEKPLSTFTTALKAFSSAQVGDGDFYKSFVDILLSPAMLQSIPTLQLIRLGVYLRRVKRIAGRGGFGLYTEIEKRLWDDIHQNRNIAIPTLLRVFGDLIPAGLGSNKLQLLLEFTLFKQLSNPENQITTAQLVQLLLDSSNYIFKYKPLFLLLQQLVEDSMDRLSSKELVKVVWSLGKNNKDCGKVIDGLVGKIRAKMESEGCSLRSMTFVLNACLNAGKTDPNLMDFLHTKLKSFEMNEKDVHYWVKSLGILAACDIRDNDLLTALLQLVSQSEIPIKGSDIVRLLCLLESQLSLLTPHLVGLQRLLIPQLVDMPLSQLARLAYVAGRVPGFSSTFLTLLETTLQQQNLMSLRPTDLAAACFSLSDSLQVSFTKVSTPAIKHFLDVLRKRVVEIDSDTEDEGETVVQEEEIQFGAQWEMTASALVQFCWTLLAADVNAGFWSERLVNSLRKIRLDGNGKFEVNHWKATAMAIQGKDEYFSTVDGPHFAMLLNILAVLRGIDQAKSMLDGISKETISEGSFMRADPTFLSQLQTFYKDNFQQESQGSWDQLLNRIDILLPGRICLLPYSPHQLCTGRLRACHLFKHKILELQGYTVRSVLQSEWDSSGQATRLLLFSS